MSRQSAFFIPLIALFIFGCEKPASRKYSSDNLTLFKGDSAIKDSIENFEDFYEKFHQDSLFQMSRILFPLEGKNIWQDENTNIREETWKKETWITLKVPVYKIDTIPKIETNSKGDTTRFFQERTSSVRTKYLVVEKIWQVNSGFQMETKYKIVKDKWFLFYYEVVSI